jgi:DNA-directed RNA polymerase specialized sigma24 family protein
MGSYTMTRQKNTSDLHPEETPSDSHVDVCELQQHTITLPLPPGLPLEAMSLSLLAECCIGEMNNYRRGEPYTDRYCVELFRRSLMQRDATAWEVLQERFHDTMLRWMCGHPMRDIACRFDSEENYVAQAFARFWLATAAHQQVGFQSVAAILRYLRMSLHSVILDALRAYSRPKEVPLPEDGDPEEPFGEDTHEGHEVWEAILHLLPDSRDQRVAYLLFHCGLKPREIIHFCPQEFSDVQEVYRLRRNIEESNVSTDDRTGCGC